MARYLEVPDHHTRIGYRVAETLESMVRHGQSPDIVVGHIGWGSMMFVKDVLPAAPALGYCEFFYRAQGADVGSLPVIVPISKRIKGFGCGIWPSS